MTKRPFASSALLGAARSPSRLFWVAPPPANSDEPALQVAVREAFAYHNQRYGMRRLRVEVQVDGNAVGRWYIHRVLQAHGLRTQQPRSFVFRTTDSDPAVRRLKHLPIPIGPHGPESSLTLLGRVVRPLLAQSSGLERARNHARGPSQRGPAPR